DEFADLLFHGGRKRLREDRSGIDARNLDGSVAVAGFVRRFRQVEERLGAERGREIPDIQRIAARSEVVAFRDGMSEVPVRAALRRLQVALLPEYPPGDKQSVPGRSNARQMRKGRAVADGIVRHDPATVGLLPVDEFFGGKTN